MALRITHVNGDSTFLLTFYPSEEEAQSNNPAVGCFSVLVDPWLGGESTIYHRKFALAKLTVPAAIQHLSELPTPNAVVVSQDRTDHCHEPTLKQLDAALPNTTIFAHPAAAKRIRSWKYFDPSKVIGFPAFNDRKRETVIRFSIPSPTLGLEAGEATLSFIPSKFDITGTHNAVGITYRAPGTATSFPSPIMSPMSLAIPSVSSPRSPTSPTQASALANMPPTPPDSPDLPSTQGHLAVPILEYPPPPKSKLGKLRARSSNALRQKAASDFGGSAVDLSTSPPLLPLERAFSAQGLYPATPATTSTAPSHSSIYFRQQPTSPRSLTSPRPRTLSVLYSPHGVSYPAVRQYAQSHLVHSAGLPLTLLLHAFDRVTNAWYMGGNIIAGLPGGVEIARNLLAKCWISAHDEDKESSGLAVLNCVTDKYAADEVRRKLAAPEKGEKYRDRKSPTDVRQLSVGETMVLCA